MAHGADLWIRLEDGRNVCMHYERAETAWNIRHSMLDQLDRGYPVQCIIGEILPESVKAIDFVPRDAV